MKTPVQVVEQIGYSNANYKYLYITILALDSDKKPYPIGRLAFLTSREKEGQEDRWFGTKFEIDDDIRNYSKLIKLAKLVEYIYKNSEYNAQPKEILKLIGAEEYFNFEYDLIPKSYIGLHKYKVLRKGEHYLSFFAANAIVAQVEFNKLHKKNNWNENFTFIYVKEVVEG